MNTLEYYQQQLAMQVLPGDKAARQVAMQKALAQGWPTHKMEAWKYTRTHFLQQNSFEPVISQQSLTINEVAPFLWPDCYHIIFYQGQLCAHLSDIPANIKVTPVAEFGACDDYGKLESALTLLNDALWQAGACITIPKQVQLDKPLQVLVVDGKEHTSQFLKIFIHAEQQSIASIVLHCASLEAGAHFTNIHIHSLLEENANINFLKIHDAAQDYYFVHHQVQQAASSQLNMGELSIGNAWLRNEMVINLKDENVQCHVFGFYLAKQQEHVDHHIVINHHKPHGTSKQFFKGIATDRGKAIFNGKVMVAKDAQKTDAEQHNQCLLLSATAEIDTKPELEIYANDVKCAHGAAVGQLPEQELFYLMARGIPEVEAKKMLMQAFAHEVFDKIDWLPVDVLMQLIDDRLLCLM